MQLFGSTFIGLALTLASVPAAAQSEDAEELQADELSNLGSLLAIFWTQLTH